MDKDGKFILMNLQEFGQWLNEQNVHRVIGLVQNHHTYEPGYSRFTGDNHFRLLKGMEESHVVDRGFSEIAQNLTSFPDGTVAVCRPFDRIPAGIKGANQTGICLENLGNFDSGRDRMEESQRDAILGINALLCRKFGLAPSDQTIVYHHWYDLNTGRRTGGAGSTKTCPGSAFFGGNSIQSALDDFIPGIEAVLSSLPGVTAPSSPAALKTADVIASSLNVREGPGTAYRIVKGIKFGVRVSAYEFAGSWCRIHPEAQHWVSGRYLRYLD